MVTKKCMDCGEDKPVPAVYAHPQAADRLHPCCRVCTSARARERYKRRSVGDHTDRRVKHVVPDGMKYRPRCGGAKAAEEFPPHASRPAGRHGMCKPSPSAYVDASRERGGGARTYRLKYRHGLDRPCRQCTDGGAAGAVRDLWGGTGRPGRPRPRDRTASWDVVLQPQRGPRPVHGRPGPAATSARLSEGG